jgi:hypothetical protein
MPRAVRVSLWLFIGSAIASPLVACLDPRPLRLFPAGANLAALVVATFFLGLLIFIAYSAYRRQNWARWVLAILGVAALATDIPSLARDLAVVPLVGMLETTVACCQTASLVLLFVPKANHWYRSAVGVDGAT